MFDNRNLAPNYSRLFSRRSNIIKFILAVLLFGTTIWITILKPAEYTIDSDPAKIEKEPTQPIWQVDLKKTIDKRFSV